MVLTVGLRRASGLALSLPVGVTNTKALTVVLSQTGPWVSSLEGGIIELAIGELSQGTVLTVTVSVHAPQLHTLAETRAELNWSDGGTTVVRSNQAGAAESAQLQLTPHQIRLGVPAVAQLAGLSSRDPVSFWVTDSDGLSLARGNALADPQGNVTFQMATDDLNSGTYLVVAAGTCSGIIAVSHLEVRTP